MGATVVVRADELHVVDGLAVRARVVVLVGLVAVRVEGTVCEEDEVDGVGGVRDELRVYAVGALVDDTDVKTVGGGAAAGALQREGVEAIGGVGDYGGRRGC